MIKLTHAWTNKSIWVAVNHIVLIISLKDGSPPAAKTIVYLTLGTTWEVTERADQIAEAMKQYV